MKNVALYIILLTAFISINSCERDHLHYETSRRALIHIEIDWEACTILEPNGVSAYVFDSNGDKYSDIVLSSDPNNVYLKLAPGDYSVVFHNNSISELDNVHIEGEDRFETFSIHANDAICKSKFETSEKYRFVDQPNDIATYTLHDIHIESNDVEYHYYKPNLADYEQEALQTFHIEPMHIVHTTRIKAYVDGLEFLSPKRPKAMSILQGMSGGYYFKKDETSHEQVKEEFEVNISEIKPDDEELLPPGDETMAFSGSALDILDPSEDGYSDEELEGLGMAYVECNTFGMHHEESDDKPYHLYLRFYLYDGTYVDYEVDVTNKIKTEDQGHSNLHTLEMILSTVPDGGGEPGDGSWDPDIESGADIFDPTLDDWEDVEVELPM